MIKVRVLNEQPLRVETNEDQGVNIDIPPTGEIIKGRDGHSPYVNESGTWMVYNDSAQEWIDTGIMAEGSEGPKGSDATVTSENIEAALGYAPANPSDIPEPYDDTALRTEIGKKQDKLTAGKNIKIEGNTISSDSDPITAEGIKDALGYTPANPNEIPEPYDDNEIRTEISKKQDKLIDKNFNIVIGEENEIADSTSSFVMGWENNVDSYTSLVFGDGNNVKGDYSSALGFECETDVGFAHAEGYATKALEDSSHAEGTFSTASGPSSHAEGSSTEASGSTSHAEGSNSVASGQNSHAEGSKTKASGRESHTEGSSTEATAYSSHAEGRGTIASGKQQHVQGKFNISDVDLSHIVGNGESNEARSNAHTLDWDGNAWFSGDVYVGSTSGTNRDDGSKRLAYVDEIPDEYDDSELRKEIAKRSVLAANETVSGKKTFTYGDKNNAAIIVLGKGKSGAAMQFGEPQDTNYSALTIYRKAADDENMPQRGDLFINKDGSLKMCHRRGKTATTTSTADSGYVEDANILIKRGRLKYSFLPDGYSDTDVLSDLRECEHDIFYDGYEAEGLATTAKDIIGAINEVNDKPVDEQSIKDIINKEYIMSLIDDGSEVEY